MTFDSMSTNSRKVFSELAGPESHEVGNPTNHL